MRLDVVERHALDIEKRLERSDLVKDRGAEFVRLQPHLAPTEAF